jgi:hypothetical protein
MSRSNLVNSVLCSLFFAIYTNSNAFAGWISPSNYDEWVLDKTSDRTMSTYQVIAIQQACRNLFPPEPREVLLDESTNVIQYRDCSNATGDVTICITGQPNNYRISRVIGHFAVINSSCMRNGDDKSTFTNVGGDKEWFRDRYSFHIQRSFNCYYYSFYGFSN